MGIQRRTLLLALLAAAGWYGWQGLGFATREVVTLRAPGSGSEEYYAQVWVVDDPPYVWLRADRPTRRWLPAVIENPRVQLVRRGERTWYRAEVRDDPETIAFVDALFARKYGFADTARGLLTRRHSVPIQLLER